MLSLSHPRSWRTWTSWPPPAHPSHPGGGAGCHALGGPGRRGVVSLLTSPFEPNLGHVRRAVAVYRHPHVCACLFICTSLPNLGHVRRAVAVYRQHASAYLGTYQVPIKGHMLCLFRGLCRCGLPALACLCLFRDISRPALKEAVPIQGHMKTCTSRGSSRPACQCLFRTDQDILLKRHAGRPAEAAVDPHVSAYLGTYQTILLRAFVRMSLMRH